MRPRNRVGFLTIGQAPRTDVVSDIVLILGRRLIIRERGALDGLSRRAIAALAPGKGDFPLVTRLRDGSAAVVGKRKIIPLLQRQIAALERQNVRLIALLCTDDFPRIQSKTLLLFPYQILLSLVSSIAKGGTIAVLVPLQEQKAAAKKKWRKTGRKVVIEHINPYQRLTDFNRVVERIKGKDISLIVLDCIGYSSKHRKQIERATGKPVLLPRSLLAEIVKELN